MRTYNYNYKTNRINFKKFIKIEIQNKRKIIDDESQDSVLTISQIYERSKLIKFEEK